jgi:twinkle protein
MDDKTKQNLADIAAGAALAYPKHLSLIQEAVERLFESMRIGLEARIGDKGYIMQIANTAIADSSAPIHDDTMDKVYAEAKAFCNSKVRGKIVSAMGLKEQLKSFYSTGFESGLSFRMWPNLSEKYRIAKREFTVVTGIPGHGKSSFMDALMIYLAEEHGWKFAVYSPENFPFEIHLEKLISLIMKKPFNMGPQYERMKWSEAEEALNFIYEHFVFIHPDEDNISLEAVLSLVLQAKEARVVDGVLIDPWNELEHNRPVNKSETEYIGEALSKVRRFARRQNIAAWVVAHPRIMQEDEKGAFKTPTPYSISGSANWYNKADNCLTVYRNALNDVDVFVQKIKYKIRGEIGSVHFTYDRATGIFSPGNKNERSSLPPMGAANND